MTSPILSSGSLGASINDYSTTAIPTSSAPSYSSCTITTISAPTYGGSLIPVDLEAAERVLACYPEDKLGMYRRPLDFIRKHTDSDGNYTCRYLPFSYHGRYYEYGGGIMTLKREIRQALLQDPLDKGEIHNYDIKKSQANALLEIFEHLGLETAPLAEILDAFDEVCAELDIPQGLMKIAIYAGVWDGSLEKRKKRGGELTAVAKEFLQSDHFSGSEEALEALKRVRKRLAPLRKVIKQASEKLGVPVGAVLTELEQAFIHAAVILCENYGIEVLSLQHDGFITRQPIPDELQQIARELSGFERAHLVEKPFSDPIQLDFEGEE